MLLEINHIFIHPLSIRLSIFKVIIDIIAFEYSSIFEINSHHFTRLEPTSLQDLLFGSLKCSILGCYQKPVIFCDDIFGWSQSISIKHTSDISAICHADRSRTIPRLKAGTDILIKSSEFGIHMRCILPWCRKH